MKNVTISLEDDVLDAGRKYAKAHSTSLNALIRCLLRRTVMSNSENWLDECFELMDKEYANSNGKQWSREDIYDV